MDLASDLSFSGLFATDTAGGIAVNGSGSPSQKQNVDGHIL